MSRVGLVGHVGFIPFDHRKCQMKKYFNAEYRQGEANEHDRKSYRLI